MMGENSKLHEVKGFLDSLGEEKQLANFDFELVQKAEFIAIERIGKKIAGIIGIWKTYRFFPTLFIVVKKEYQDKRVGDRLMKKEIEYARKAHSFLTLSTFDNGNYDAAIHLYKKWDFELFSRSGSKIWMCTSFNSKGKVICISLPFIFFAIRFFFRIISRIKSK
jgi:ribosomal protein S18 acetylase RimI-like enzyme